MSARFEVIAEVEPATRPDLTRVRHQVGVLAPVADAFLIPDNHLGRATVSSLAVAHEVASMGVSAIACLNSRDRNKLGFQRDLLTAAAYGIDRFLCVFGDRPTSGGRSNDLTVRAMLEEIRTFGTSETFAGHGPVQCRCDEPPGASSAVERPHGARRLASTDVGIDPATPSLTSDGPSQAILAPTEPRRTTHEPAPWLTSIANPRLRETPHRTPGTEHSPRSETPTIHHKINV